MTDPTINKIPFDLEDDGGMFLVMPIPLTGECYLCGQKSADYVKGEKTKSSFKFYMCEKCVEKEAQDGQKL